MITSDLNLILPQWLCERVQISETLIFGVDLINFIYYISIIYFKTP